MDDNDISKAKDLKDYEKEEKSGVPISTTGKPSEIREEEENKNESYEEKPIFDIKKQISKLPPLEENNPEEDKENKKQWYLLRVQSGKEEKVRENLKRKIQDFRMESYFGQILVPHELLSEVKKGQRRIVERKLYPGYVVIEMLLTDESHYLVKGTPGVGDFVGTHTTPIPMSSDEVERMLVTYGTGQDKPKPKVQFKKGQNVKIKEGPFENFDGIVDEVNEQKGIVKVIVGIFGRYTQVELEYWQVENL